MVREIIFYQNKIHFWLENSVLTLKWKVSKLLNINNVID
jgi:hypothetical protein